MRRATMEDLPEIIDFIYQRFLNLEHFTFMTEHMEQSEEILKKFIKAELLLFLEHGDIRVYGEPIIGMISSIPAKKFTLFRQFVYSLPTRKVLKELPKKDRKQLLQKNKLVAEIHHALPWHRKYSKNSYYIAQIAVAEEAKGTGVMRKLLTPIFEECQEKNMDIVLETMTEANIPIYEHFGFKLAEIHQSENVPYDEYCFIKNVN